jgi:UDP-N-acetylmuramyl pentapeptide phosphotransferase/UDP-N-acetylglucosamine-1-phosphate transferase
MICNCLQIIRFFVFLTIGFHDENKQIAWRDDLASAAFGKITAVYVPVGCLNYVHFDDMGRHMSVSIEHFFWTCSAFNEKRRMFTKSIAV